MRDAGDSGDVLYGDPAWRERCARRRRDSSGARVVARGRFGSCVHEATIREHVLLRSVCQRLTRSAWVARGFPADNSHQDPFCRLPDSACPTENRSAVRTGIPVTQVGDSHRVQCFLLHVFVKELSLNALQVTV